MNTIVSYVKTHKLVLFLLAVIGFLLVSMGTTAVNFANSGRTRSSSSYDAVMPMAVGGSDIAMKSAPMEANLMMPIQEAAPVAGQPRMVIQQSYLSLLVKDVTQIRDQILAKVEGLGGYMVNAHFANPMEAPSATITMRVPTANLEEMLSNLRGMAVRVVSEELSGQDVTDEYVDIEKQIAIQERTKAKFESILESAQEISDITELTRQIIYTQNQIDSYKGMQEGLSKRAELTLVTVYLSTDELALPYAPSDVWRPEVIFKLAVRSMIGNLRSLGSGIIWIGVYGAIWIPALIILIVLKRKFGGKKK